MDYYGRLCGYHDDVKDKSRGYYMPSGTVVCVKKCPTETDYSKFICYDEFQEASDNDLTVAWTNVANKVCMFEATTSTGISTSYPLLIDCSLLLTQFQCSVEKMLICSCK